MSDQQVLDAFTKRFKISLPLQFLDCVLVKSLKDDEGPEAIDVGSEIAGVHIEGSV